MNKIDPAVAKRVWQRVQGEDTAEKVPQIQTLIYRELALASACRRLAAARPEAGLRLKQVAKAAQNRAVCLRGMGYLESGSRPQSAPEKKKTEPVDRVLRFCCQKCMQAVRDYERQKDHSEYGCIYEQMAQEHRGHYRLFLELLG